MREGKLLRWANLLYILKYSLVFGVLLVGLPLTVLPGFPGGTLLGGLFLELNGWGLFWAALGFFAAAWALMITVGLLVDGVVVRWDAKAQVPRPTADTKTKAAGYLPSSAVAVLDLPIIRGQFLGFTGLGVWAVAWTAGHADPETGLPARVLAPLAALLLAYLLLQILALPARWADPDFQLFQRSRLQDLLWRGLDRIWLRRLFGRLRDWVSIPCRLLHLRGSLEEGEDGRPRLGAGHFLAITLFLGMLVIVFAVGWVHFPPKAVTPSPPAVNFLYVLLILLIWTLSGLTHNLAPFHVSPLVALLVILLVVYVPQDVDHYYEARHTDESKTLTPVEVVKNSRRPENLVIIASSGGGILAAGWLNLGLRRMIQDRPELAEEIRLLSTVSGSSVGAAFYAHGVNELPSLTSLSAAEREAALQDIYDRSVASSLASAAYGFAFLDFWRLFLGDAPPLLQRWDRGMLLEDNWRRNADPASRYTDPPQWLQSSFDEAIADGRLPSLVFSSTIMETGRRVMMTPLQFPALEPCADAWAQTAEENRVTRQDCNRALTLSEYLSPEGKNTRLSVWTAARLSATFPYVTSAARARFGEPVPKDQPRHWGHHVIDGGYFDNFGVASALDWLYPVLQDLRQRKQRGEEVRLKRVFLLRLTPFRITNPQDTHATEGVSAALAGPLLGILSIQGGIATSRNAIDLERYLALWNDLLQNEGLETCVATAQIRPPSMESGEEPLSWHLTQDQIEAQRALWPEDPEAAGPDSVVRPWRALKEFLEGDDCPRAPGFSASPASAVHSASP